MRSAIIGFVAGAGWLQMQATLPQYSTLFLLVMAAVLVGFFSRIRQLRRANIPLLLLAGTCFGFAWAALFAHHYLARELPAQWEGRDVTIIGTVDSLPGYFERGVRFNFAVEKVLPVDGELPVLPPKLISLYFGPTIAVSEYRMERPRYWYGR